MGPIEDTQPSRPYRILLTTWQDFGAGSIQSVQYLAEGLLKRGHDVRVACPRDGVLGSRLQATGVPVVPLTYPRGWSLRAARQIARIAHKFDIELIDAQESRDRKAALLARWFFGAKSRLVITRRQMTATAPMLNRLYARHSDRIIAISHGVARDLHERGAAGANISVVHTGLAGNRVQDRPGPDEVERLGARHGLREDLPTVGVVARRKDQETLLRAASILGRPLNLLMVGIEKDERLAELEPGLPAGSIVVYTGFESRVLPYYDLLDVMVLTTRREGLSQAILESMALGVPVITAAVGGTPEVVEEEVSGLHYSPGAADELAKQLKRLLDEPQLGERLSAEGRSRVEGHFSAEAFVRRTERVYRELLEGEEQEASIKGGF